MTSRIERSHTIEVEGEALEVLHLLTPRGEESWIAEWRPDYIEPPSGETQERMVFRTGEGEGITFWCCVTWAPSDLQARYARVTPSTKFGLVDVSCRPSGPKLTAVTVRYTYTALSPAGRAELDAMSQDAFEAMIEGWRGDMNRRLAQLAEETGSG